MPNASIKGSEGCGFKSRLVCFQVTAFGKLLACMLLSPSSILKFGTTQWAVMFFGWEENGTQWQPIIRWMAESLLQVDFLYFEISVGLGLNTR